MSLVSKKVQKELSEIKTKKGIYTFVSKPTDYNEVNEELISNFTKKLKLSGIYVTLNKTYGELVKDLSEKKIPVENILFIDGSDKKISNAENCISLEGNKSLTKLSIIMSQACKNELIKFILFDSFSALLIYNNLKTTEKFIHYFMNKIKNLDLLFIGISIKEGESDKLSPILAQFSDKFIEI